MSFSTLVFKSLSFAISFLISGDLSVFLLTWALPNLLFIPFNKVSLKEIALVMLVAYPLVNGTPVIAGINAISCSIAACLCCWLG